MELQGTFIVNAGKERVWELFMDFEKLGGCAPGVENLRMLDETHFEAEMVVKIQFMTIRFQATGELIEASGNRLKMELHGKPAALAGMFRNQLEVVVAELEEAEQTKVDYRMNIHMTGRLASLGSILVKSTVTKTAEQFADNVKALFPINDAGEVSIR